MTLRFLILIFVLISCGKKNYDKIEETIYGKWEPHDLLINNKCAWEEFKSSNGYFSSITFYPENNYYWYFIDFESQLDGIEKWQLEKKANKTICLSLNESNHFQPGTTSQGFNNIPFQKNGWTLKKITNNKMVLTSNDELEIKLILKKTGKFE